MKNKIHITSKQTTKKSGLRLVNSQGEKLQVVEKELQKQMKQTSLVYLRTK